MSDTFKNLKIPYPTEGVIRSAQLNDTVCPENSVQSAVNMNFDRVGAIQTRPGVETFATQLAGEVNQFGTLNNSITVVGFDTLLESNIKNALVPGDVGWYFEAFSSAKIDDTHFILFYAENDNSYGTAQVVSVDTTTGTMTKVGTPVLYEPASTALYNTCIKVDATHFLNLWQSGSSVDQYGYAQIFEVNNATWDVSKIGSPLTFYAGVDQFNTITQVDASHFLVFWDASTASDGYAQVLAVNLSTWAVTKIGSPLSFVSVDAYHNSCCKLSATKYVNTWISGGDARARIFNVDAGTFAVTTAGAEFTFDANGERPSCHMFFKN